MRLTGVALICELMDVWPGHVKPLELAVESRCFGNARVFISFRGQRDWGASGDHVSAMLTVMTVASVGSKGGPERFSGPPCVLQLEAHLTWCGHPEDARRETLVTAPGL